MLPRKRRSHEHAAALMYLRERQSAEASPVRQQQQQQRQHGQKKAQKKKKKKKKKKIKKITTTFHPTWFSGTPGLIDQRLLLGKASSALLGLRSQVRSDFASGALFRAVQETTKWGRIIHSVFLAVGIFANWQEIWGVTSTDLECFEVLHLSAGPQKHRHYLLEAFDRWLFSPKVEGKRRQSKVSSGKTQQPLKNQLRGWNRLLSPREAHPAYLNVLSKILMVLKPQKLREADSQQKSNVSFG